MSQTLGSGLYLSLAYYNHSCFPNCALVIDGLKASLRVIRCFSLDEEKVKQRTIFYLIFYEKKRDKKLKIKLFK